MISPTRSQFLDQTKTGNRVPVRMRALAASCRAAGRRVGLQTDGLAAGKGVLILGDLEVAKEALKEMLLESKFGEASRRVVIEEFLKGIWRDNPVFAQVLGMCPMLAVTNSAINAVAMGMATFFVLVGSSFLVSTFRNVIPKQVRISCFIIIIATFVTVADYTLLALVPKVHKELGAFISLIVVNCLILGRQEIPITLRLGN